MGDKYSRSVLIYSLWFRMRHADLWEPNTESDSMINAAMTSFTNLSKVDFYTIAMKLPIEEIANAALQKSKNSDE
jgi:hypothetical protein